MSDGFAALLRQLMEANELSGAALGRMLDGADKSQVSRWRSGQDRPEPATIVKIADIFAIDPIVLLQTAGVLPGEPAAIDPRRASLIRIVRDDVSEEDLSAVERLLHAFAVPVTQQPSNGLRDPIANWRSGDTVDHTTKRKKQGHTGSNGSLPISSHWLGRIVQPFGLGMERPLAPAFT